MQLYLPKEVDMSFNASFNFLREIILTQANLHKFRSLQEKGKVLKEELDIYTREALQV
jgi:hypothetical protein